MSGETVKKSLPEHFLGLVESLIDETGVYPHPAMTAQEDGGLVVMALDMNVHDWTHQFWNQVQGVKGRCAEIAFGLDMRTMPDQGTEFADALVFVHWTHNPSKKLADPSCFRTGVINYQHDPRIVRPIDWHNPYWTHWMNAWFQKNKPPFLVRTVKSK